MEITKEEKQQYQSLVKEMTPKSKVLSNCFKAFVSGGAICVLGEFFLHFYTNKGLNKDMAGLAMLMSLMLISSILTGIGIYDKLGKFCGAGTIVPITGFANSVVSPAIEFKKEGYVFGMAAKMFTIAGPVIVYGTVTSVIVGFIYYFLK